MTSIITVKNISKKYNITHQQGGYVALRDVIANIAKKPFSFIKRRAKAMTGRTTKEEFWALKDINFEIFKGEAVGIIGANGAGKSTLLKILTGITPPTTGEIKMHGKIASLLEVGTGFHSELTGRENIFLNGAILGMTKEEIADKFDAIVEFSGVQKFIDTPVKRYSSGMLVRLGFSVAAHMEPDILLVDEVLAVGDADFQKKCLGKMDEVTHAGGRTILFVSHNMSAIQNLCSRCILLEEGKTKMIGETKEVINEYLKSKIGPSASKKWTDINNAPGDNIVRLCSVEVKQEKQTTDTVNIQLPVEIEMEYKVIKSGSVLIPNYHFFNESGICIFVSSDQNQKWQKKIRPTGTYRSSLLIPGNFLSDGILTIGVAMSTFTPVIVHFYKQDAVTFRVIDNFKNSPTRGEYTGPIPGVLRPLLNWETQFKEK